MIHINEITRDKEKKVMNIERYHSNIEISNRLYFTINILLRIEKRSLRYAGQSYQCTTANSRSVVATGINLHDFR